MKLAKVSLSTASLALILAACTPAETPAEPEAAPAAEEVAPANDTMTGDETMMEESMEDAMTDVEADREMTVDMFAFGYSEETITASPGETILVNLTNSDGFHDFVIDELDVASEQINEGDETSVLITIPEDAEPGTEYAYYCSVGQHRAQGMEGTLIIE